MYQRLPDVAATADRISVTIDGRPFNARPGDSVAATLLAAGFDACRTTAVNGAQRGPYCMMGVCFDCLVMIDGQPNRQGCMIAVADGMAIATQQGARAVEVDAASGAETK
jgi:hypothetical protein